MERNNSDTPKRTLTVENFEKKPLEIDFFDQMIKVPPVNENDMFAFLSQPAEQPKVSPRGQQLLNDIFGKLKSPKNEPPPEPE